MRTLTSEAMLGMSMRFRVHVDGIDLGSWATCAGLSVDFKHILVKEGANYEHPVILPDRVEYKAITLKRAMTQQDSALVQQWLAQVVRTWYNTPRPREGQRTAQIHLYDAKGGNVATWTLRNVYPAAWAGPDLDASGSGIAVESLQLVHEGFL